MDTDVKSQFLKNVATGVAEKVGIMAATWLVSTKLLPADQLTGGEAVIGALALSLMVFGYTWWKEHGQAMVMQAFKMMMPESPPSKPAA